MDSSAGKDSRSEEERAARARLRQGVPVLGGRFRLTVSPDGMTALLRPGEGEVLREEDFGPLARELAAHGIVYGLLEPPRFEPPVWVVARGDPPVPGEDARLVFLVDVERGPRKKGPYLDYREMNALVCVRRGDPIAQKVPPRPGSPGRNVFGEPIPPPPVRDVSLRLGENVSYDEETGYVKATADGALRLEGERIEVLPEFELAHDVDWDTGNIRFYGRRLTILGSVRRGFRVLCEGDLEITGNVEDDTEIEVEGNLIVGGLIHGPARISCRGEARLAEVEYAEVETGGALVVSEYALQVRARVGGELVVTEGVGAVIGGEFLVKGQAVVRLLGSRASVKTVLRAGYDPEVMAALEEVKGRLMVVECEKGPLKRLLRKALDLYRAGKLSPAQIRALEKAKVQFERLLTEERRLLAERRRLVERLEEAERVRVFIYGHVFPNVVIGIGRFEHLVTRTRDAGVFVLKKTQIVFEPAGS